LEDNNSIVIENDTLNFGIIQTGVEKTKEISLSNYGSNDIIVNKIYSTNDKFVPLQETLIIPGYSSEIINVKCLNSVDENLFGTLVIESNANLKHQTIKLIGQSKIHDLQVSIHQNPAFTNNCNINIISNIPLKKTPKIYLSMSGIVDTLSIDSLQNAFYTTSYNYLGFGSGKLEVHCESKFGLDAVFQRNFNISQFKKGIPLTVNLADKYFLSIADNSSNSDVVYSVIENSIFDKEKDSNLLSKSNIHINPSTILNGNNYLNVSYEKILKDILFDEKNISIYQHDGKNWHQIESYIDTDLKVLRAKITSTGTFSIGYGSNESYILTVPEKFSLHQNYPNPFNSSTTVKFELPEAQHITIEIYDILGRKINTIVEQYFDSGIYKYSWNGKNAINLEVSSGIFFYVLKSKNWNLTKKMIMLK